MNLKPNQHKIISFNTTTMTSLGFIDPPKILGPPLNLAPPKFNFLLRSPQLFWSEIFRSPLKLGGLLPWANFKIHDIKAWLTNNCHTHIAQYLRK